MPKLITFGCSLSHPYGWKDLLAEDIGFDVHSSAMIASSNNLQVKRAHSLIVNDVIEDNDIIIWQVTGFERSSFSFAPEQSWKDHLDNFERNPDPLWAECPYYADSPVNYFDGLTHIDVLSNHPAIKKSAWYYDPTQALEELLSMLILLNRSYKVLVFVGWPGALQEHWNTFMQSLQKHQIPHMSKAMTDWILDSGFELDWEDPTGAHPTMESSEEYAKGALYPKLQELGWI